VWLLFARRTLMRQMRALRAKPEAQEAQTP
jgi:hypothetical protein